MVNSSSPIANGGSAEKPGRDSPKLNLKRFRGKSEETAICGGIIALSSNRHIESLNVS
jgi:hypothetical protein